MKSENNSLFSLSPNRFDKPRRQHNGNLKFERFWIKIISRFIGLKKCKLLRGKFSVALAGMVCIEPPIRSTRGSLDPARQRAANLLTTIFDVREILRGHVSSFCEAADAPMLYSPPGQFFAFKFAVEIKKVC